MDHEKPGSPGDILAHYGKKGMRWGIRKEEDTGGGGGSKTPTQTAERNAQIKDYMSAANRVNSQTRSKKQAAASLTENHKKFSAKFDDASGPLGPKASGKSPTGKITAAPKSKKSVKEHWNSLSPGQQKAIIYGGGLALGVGGAVLLGKAKQRQLLAMAGTSIPKQTFQKNVLYSQVKTWGFSGFVQDSSFARPAFELPAGHEFFRLSRAAEEGFSEATYATHNLDDYHRYLAGFTQEIGTHGIHQVSWKTKVPTKVPDLNTVLNEMHNVLETEGHKPDKKMVIDSYQALSGSGWTSDRSKKLMAALKRKGYGAIVDEMDAGVIGDTPLVFFGHENATPKRTKPLTHAQIEAATRMITELQHRKV